LLREILEDGSFSHLALTALGVALILVGERAAMSGWWGWYFRIALPLPEDPVPIRAPPEQETGVSGGLRWIADRPGHVVWAAERGANALPVGLHGTVDFAARRDGVGLIAAWCPPWTPFLALAWFAALGTSEGQAFVAGPIAAVIAAVMFLVFQESAVRAIARLRYVWASGGEEE
jgi:hypothetical protein